MRARRALLCKEICAGLEVALLDLRLTEDRARNAESRCRLAEYDLAIARSTINRLQAENARLASDEFKEQPTAVRSQPDGSGLRLATKGVVVR